MEKIILTIAVLLLFGCGNQSPRIVEHNSQAQETKPQSSIQTKTPKVTSFSGTEVPLSQVKEEKLRVMGVEAPPAYVLEKDKNKLVYDTGFKELGFKTLRTDFGDTLEVVAEVPGVYQEKGSFLFHPEYQGGPAQIDELCYGAWFAPPASMADSDWTITVTAKGKVILKQTLRIPSESFTFAKEEKPSVFPRRGSFDAKPGEKFYISYRLSDPAENRLILYFWNMSRIDGVTKEAYLEPVLAAQPEARGFYAAATLTIGTDLKDGEYKLGTGIKTVNIRSFDSWIGISSKQTE